MNKGVLPVVVSTQDVWDYLDSTNGQIKEVAIDYGNNPDIIPKSDVIAWEKFYYEWNDFYDTNRNTTHIFGAAGVMDLTDTYMERLKGYRDKIKSILANAGRPMTSNEIVPPSYSEEKSDLISQLKPFGYGVAAGVFVFILIKIVK